MDFYYIAALAILAGLAAAFAMACARLAEDRS